MRKRIYKVWTIDGNQMLFAGETMFDVLSYVLFVKGYNDCDIYSIEVVDAEDPKLYISWQMARTVLKCMARVCSTRAKVPLYYTSPHFVKCFFCKKCTNSYPIICAKFTLVDLKKFCYNLITVKKRKRLNRGCGKLLWHRNNARGVKSKPTPVNFKKV